jgi:GNAT superfamily N-acetyltransferase
VKVIRAEFKDSDGIRGVVLQWQEVCRNAPFDIVIDVDKLKDDFDGLIEDDNKDLLLLVNDDNTVVGFMGIILFDTPFGKIANEHYWFVAPEYRGENSLSLIAAAKLWAKEKGCDYLMMNASMLASDLHDRVCRFYEHIGMVKFETSYILRI